MTMMSTIRAQVCWNWKPRIASQSVVLYIDPSVDIPEGSKITVTQNGMTRDYERSGKSAVYSCHQEVPLELFKEWA